MILTGMVTFLEVSVNVVAIVHIIFSQDANTSCSKVPNKKASTTKVTTDETLDEKSNDNTKLSSRKPRGKITPYKAKDLVPIVCTAIASNPSLSNTVMERLLSPYGKTGKGVTVFTDNLLQNMRKLVREDVFGDPTTNATYALALKCELEKRGHDVHVGLLDRSATLKNIYNIVWEDFKGHHPFAGATTMWMSYTLHWVM